jgi:hypothetical protein
MRAYTYVTSISADFTTNATTATNVTGLFFPIGINEIWVFRFHLGIGKASGTAGIKMAMSFPSGTTLHGNVWGSTTPLTAFTLSTITASATLTAEVYAITAASTGKMHVWGRAASTSTAGNIQLQVASVTSQNAIITAGSHLEATRQS